MAASVRFAVALHVLVLLALERRAVTSAYIAGSVNTNPVVVRRILGAVRRAGLVAAHTGPGGGFRLRKPGAQITLADVYRAVEGAPIIAQHDDPNRSCPVGRHVGGVIEVVARRAERAMLGSLAASSLHDVAGRVKRRAAVPRARKAM